MSTENGPELLEGSAEDTTRDRYMTFNIDSEEYGIGIAYVKEIIEIVPITRVPESPPYVEGIFNLRGDIIGVLDVRKRFGKSPKEHDEQTCIIVVEHKELVLGLIVDSVNEVMTIEEDSILAPPNAKLNHYNQYIRNIGQVSKGVVLLLDLEKLLIQDVQG
ncbi:MAG: chemotaxis protein CheW [Clostridiales bacterium]|jgi:purine-binding chemotaxis protein CheW|nr:chemotaxis protein CheW [Clostridiales bacterium]MDR2751707.1 chemotaxis protein CheW [Clostridiales bacterium]